MGLLDGLSAGLTAGTKAATGVQQGNLQGSQLLRAIQMQQYQIQKEQAETDLAQAHAANFRRQTARPQLGDGDPYNDAKGGEAAAIANAQIPAHVQTAVQSAQGTEPIKTAGAIATAAGVEPIKTAGAINTAAGVAPIHTRQAIATAQGTAPIEVQKAKDIGEATLPGKITLEQAKLNNQPLKQDEAYTAMHLPRMAQGITAIQKATAPGAWQTMAHKGMMGNYTLTPQGQQYNAAADRVALSGAVMMEGPRGATPQRIALFKKTYLPQPGDDDATVADKLAQLREVVRSGKTKAGRGYDRMDPSQRAALESFIGGGAGPSATPQGSDAPGTYTFGGKTYKVP